VVVSKKQKQCFVEAGVPCNETRHSVIDDGEEDGADEKGPKQKRRASEREDSGL